MGVDGEQTEVADLSHEMRQVKNDALEQYQNVSIAELKNSVSSKAINGKYSQSLLRKNKSTKFRRGSGVNQAGSDENSTAQNMVVFKVAGIDGQLRKTVDSPMNLSQIARSMPKMKVYTNEVAPTAGSLQHPDGSGFATRLHELSR